MAAHAGEKARETGDFYCASCDEKVGRTHIRRLIAPPRAQIEEDGTDSLSPWERGAARPNCASSGAVTAGASIGTGSSADDRLDHDAPQPSDAIPTGSRPHRAAPCAQAVLFHEGPSHRVRQTRCQRNGHRQQYPTQNHEVIASRRSRSDTGTDELGDALTGRQTCSGRMGATILVRWIQHPGGLLRPDPAVSCDFVTISAHGPDERVDRAAPACSRPWRTAAAA